MTGDSPLLHFHHILKNTICQMLRSDHVYFSFIFYVLNLIVKEFKMLSKLFVLRLFEGFSIQRWNDRIRPFDLTEMDKNAFKAVIAYFLGKYAEKNGKKVDWNYIIYGIFFALLKNIVLSDLKSPVHRLLKNKYPIEFKKLNEWVIQQYEYIIEDSNLLNNFRKFLIEDSDEESINLKILRAAHKYSTYREFCIIKQLNMEFPFIQKIEKELNSEMEKFMEFQGIKNLYTKQQLYELVCTIEQLRYQIRWSQTPRVPRTSVLGHSLFVACLMIIFSRKINACQNRLYNNFFGALFHDLPEAVTRDIISPVKRATEKLPDIIKEIEKKVCQESLYPLIPEFMKEEVFYLIGEGLGETDEFSNRIYQDEKPKILGNDEKICDYNKDKFNPIDGKLIELADKVSAFLEAQISIQHGITSRHLQNGSLHIKNKYIRSKEINGIRINKFFMEF